MMSFFFSLSCNQFWPIYTLCVNYPAPQKLVSFFIRIFLYKYYRSGYIVRDHHDTMIDCLEQISTINVRIDFIIEK